MPKTAEPKQVIEGEVLEVLALQNKLEETENQLMQNDQFRDFLELQKSFREKSAAVWAEVEKQMIDNNIKSIKGDWGSLTVAERTNYKADLDELPSKFIKKVADTTKIGTYHKLENKLPKGVTTSTTKYLTKKIK